MSAQQHKALLRHIAERFNAHDWDGYFTLYNENVRVHGFPVELAPGLDGLRQFYGAFDAAFTDAHFQIEDLVAEDDRVSIRYTLRATHVAPFMDIPPSGRRIEVRGMTLLRFENGKVAERWQHMDDLGLLQQLGALPAPEASGATDPLALSRTLYDRFSRNDFGGVLDIVDDEIEAVLVPFGQTFRGKEGFVGFMRGFKDAFPDIRIDVTSQFASEGQVVNEFTARGTHTGPLQTPAGPIPPTGRTVDFTVCEVLAWQDGKLRSLHNYQDAAGLMRQLGLEAAPA